MNASTNHVGSLPESAGQVAENIAQEATRFGELAKAWWNRNANFLRDAALTARDEAAALHSRTRLYVKDEPVKSVLIAAATGAVITGLVMLVLKHGRAVD